MAKYSLIDVAPCGVVISFNPAHASPAGSCPAMRLRKKITSVTTSVPALSLNAVCGKRIAPTKSARSDRYLRARSLALSIVPFDVTNTNKPPSLTRSMVLAKK